MTTATRIAQLQSRFATALPELALPAVAADAPEPQLVVLNEPLALELGLDPDRLRTPEGLGLLTGTVVPEGAKPVAQAYAGHQFGGFAQLGDGRALLMGELVDPAGRLRDLHLKGSGRTRFARGGDGLAALGPMLREYVVSEAMHALGIPTTRSLAVVATGRGVRREEVLPGAVLARVASSHLRVGTVQLARAASAAGGADDGATDVDLLRRVVDHAIERHHPDAATAAQPYLAFYRAVISAQADLVARWMLVGFVHGVMNTDNMTLSGETIDYGPCAFLDAYDPATVFSSIDEGGRYAFVNQPPAAEWNLARLGEALLPLLDDTQDRAVEIAVEALGSFRTEYATAYSTGLRAKLGVTHADPADADPLAATVLELLEASHVDHTSFWRHLATAARGEAEPVRGMFLDLAGLDDWLDRWRALAPDPDAMDAVNPVHVPRNHLVEQALAAATAGDLAPLGQLLEAVRDPFRARAGLERYAEPAPEDFGRYRTFCGT